MPDQPQGHVVSREEYLDQAHRLMAQGRYADAVKSYDGVLARKSDDPEAWNGRGVALHNLNRFQDALSSFERAIASAPRFAFAYSNRGNALKALGRPQDALASYDRALALAPRNAEIHSNRGALLLALGRADQALAACDRAIARNPDHAPAHDNRANALTELRRLPEALDSYDRALTLDPDSAQTHSNRGTVLLELGRLDAAHKSFSSAIARQPDLAEAHWNRAMTALLMGDYDNGLPDYEWRLRRAGAPPAPVFLQPLWLGRQDIAGKTLLLHSEQAYGDTIQFCRYALAAKAMGAHVVVLALPELARLLRSLGPTIQVCDGRTPLPPFDYHTPLPSAPLAFATKLQTIPAPVPYLAAEPERVRRWGARIGAHGFRVGICWQGNKAASIDIGRSFCLTQFAPLSRLAGVRLISLQKNDGVEQLADLPPGMTVETLGDDFDSGPDAFLDSAAVMAHLDLVITSDTAMAHLAGALGRPAWVALKHVPDWRWLMDRPDSPWYPTLTLFRQAAPDAWEGVFAAMAAALAQRSGG